MRESPVAAQAVQLASDPRWQLVQRVVASRAFAGSQPLQDFLLYIAERTLLGCTDEIKEQTIGNEVLRRDGNFDPAQDNIVRVRARQLRLKLEQFFQAEGASEPMVIAIPRGGYIPVFEPRVQNPTPAPVPPEPEIQEPAFTPLPTLLPWAVAGILAVACLLLWLAAARKPARPNLSRDTELFWSQIFGKGEKTLAVVSDPGFGLWQVLNHKDLNLQEYLRLRYAPAVDSGQPDLSRLLAGDTISLSAAHFLTSAIPITEALDSALRVRPARQIDVSDFKTGNVILFGSRRSNPWAELFEPHLHYAAIYREGVRSYFEERSAAGASATFPPGAGSGAPADSFALIALLPNLANNGKVLFIEGLTMEGTDAACEFLLNPQSCDLLVRRIASEMGSMKPFEALLQLTPVSGGSANIRLIRLRAPLP